VSINEIRKCTNLMAQNEIHFRLELTIESSKIAECKKLVQEMVKVVEANADGLADHDRCRLRDRHR
jgi:hypothetical protein